MKTLVKPTVVNAKNEDQYQALCSELELCPSLSNCTCFNVCNEKWFADEEQDDILF